MVRRRKMRHHYFHVLEAVLWKQRWSRTARLVIPARARVGKLLPPEATSALEGPILEIAARPRSQWLFGVLQSLARIQMAPRMQRSQLLLPFQDMVSKAMDLPHESQRGDYIEVKLKANWRTFDKALREARALWWSSSAALTGWLHKAGMRNVREVVNLLVDLEDLDCDNGLLRCLANGKYESGHGAMQAASQRGELRELLQRERVASLAWKAIVDDCACADSFLRKRRIWLDRRTQLLRHVLANARP